MATLYAKAAGGNWSAAGTWSNVNAAGVDNSGPPTAADNVIFELASGNVTIDTGATRVCRSLDCQGGTGAYTGTISGTATLNIGDATAPTGGRALRLASGMTWSHTGIVGFVSTNASTHTITSAGKTLGGSSAAVNFNTAASSTTYQLSDALACAQNLSKTSTNTLDTNGQSVTCASLNITGGTLTCGASVVTATNGNGNQTVTPSTLTAGTSEFVFSVSAGNRLSLSANKSFYNLTISGAASKTCELSFSNATGPTVTNTLSIGGNGTQGVNRLLVDSSVLGTQRTIDCTGATVVITGDVDFQDVTITGSPTWTNTGSKFVGDCGGNGGAVTTNRTTPATQTATGTASFTWSTHGWTSRVPLPQDDVSIPNAFVAGRTITADMPRLGASITCTCTGSPTLNISTTATLFGSLTLASGMVPSGSNSLTFAGRSSYTLTMNGTTFSQGMTVAAPSGTLTFQDATTSSRSATFAIFVSAGTLNDGGQTVTLTGAAGQFAQSGGTATLTGTWNHSVTGTSTFWSVTAGTCTHSGTITLTATSANTRTFAGGGQTYGTLTYTVAGSTGGLTITGNNSWTAINFSDASNAKTLTLTGTTQTVASAAGLNINGTSGKLMGITGGTISIASGTVECRFLNLTSQTATGGANFYAPSSTDSGGNSGWNINVVPPITITDTVGLTDTATPSLAFTQTVADTVGIVDSADPVATLNVTVNDPLGLLDDAALAQTFAAAITDNLGLVDDLTAALDIAVTVDDPLGLVDDPGIVLPITLDINDPLGLLDTADITQAIALAIADMLGLTDELEALVPFVIADTIGLTDRQHVRVEILFRGPTSGRLATNGQTAGRLATNGATRGVLQ